MGVVRGPSAVHSRIYSSVGLVAAVLMAVGCSDGSHLSYAPKAGAEASGAAPYRVPVAQSVALAVERGDVAGALVLLDSPSVPSSSGSSAGVDGTAQVAEVQAEVLGSLPQGMLADLHTYKYFPVMYAAVGQEALEALTEHPAVLEVFENRVFLPDLTESLALVRQPEVALSGPLGAGTSVAVLDTGTDYTRPAFGSCSAPGVPGCRVVVARDFAPEDYQLDEHGHGTNVAGIVAGVAPGAGILGLDVFTGGGAYSNVILAAIEWVIANRATYNVVAVNMSLGAGLYTGSCANDVFASGVAALRDAGILPVIASGNNGASDAISSPACVPAALSVGAVYDGNVGSPSYPSAGCTDPVTAADRVTCFSNSNAQLSMLAPGASIVAAGLQMSGTSQAAPHVAGAAAVLAAAFPSATTAELFTRLTGSGPMITDPRNGIVLRRLDLVAALALDPGTPAPDGPSPEPTPDPDPPAPGDPPPEEDAAGPTGTVTIEGGAETVATRRVTVTLSAQDTNGVASMCVANRASCRRFVPFQESFAWTLSRGDGPRSVYVWLRDGLGNRSEMLSDSIVVDTAPPLDGVVQVEVGDGTVQLTMTGARDAQSSALSYRVVGAVGTQAPVSCDGGSVLYSGVEPSTVLTGLSNGVTFALRMCAVDEIGHASRGVVVTARPAPEFEPPTGTVTIDGDAVFTATREVTLTISAQDESGVASMCISGVPRCANYVPYAESVPFLLGRSNGVATVFVYLRDAWGNETTTAITDSIIYDSAAPRDGRISVEAGDGSVQITMEGAVDAQASDLSYVVVGAVGTKAPANCALGTELYRGPDATALITGLDNGVLVSLRMCVMDESGHVSRGAWAMARPAPEFEPPSGTVTIDGGATHTASRLVTLTISAQDPSGILAMCISGTPRCTRYVPFAQTVPMTLRRSNGIAMVYVSLEDAWGNRSTAAMTDSIIVDTAGPQIWGLAATQSGTGRVDHTWSAYDPGTGVGGYTLQYAPGRTAPRGCTLGTRVYAGQGTGFTHTGLPAGQHGYRLCATDQLGNTSSRTYVVTVQ